MPNELLTKRRVLALNNAVDELLQIRGEMPAKAAYIETTVQRLRTIAKDYATLRQDLAELSRAERRPPQRVPMRARRKAPVIPMTRSGPKADPYSEYYETDRTTPVAPLDSCHNTRVELSPPIPAVKGVQRCNCGPADVCPLCREE